jgi:hypothetical protein
MGLDAYQFNTDEKAQWAFRCAIANQFVTLGDPVYCDKVTFNLVTSLTTTRKLQNGRKLVEKSGIGINYNVTVNIEQLGFTDPTETYETLSSQLVLAIANGNFTEEIQNQADILGVSTLLSAGSSSSDFTLREFVYVFTEIITNPPTGAPTGAPTTPSSVPTSAPTHMGGRKKFEVVAGLILTSIFILLQYLVTVATSYSRRLFELPDKTKIIEEEIPEENHEEQDELDVLSFFATKKTKDPV